MQLGSPLQANTKQWYDLLSEKEGPNGRKVGTTLAKRGFAMMTKRGVIMDVTSAEQAQIAEEAGAVAVMVLDKLPADVRKVGGVARPASIKRIQEILDHTTIPVMAKCRIGHTYEAQVLQASGVDMVDESEVLTPADEARHIWKWPFKVPFVNGCRNLGEALRRIEEGCTMIRTKGEPGTGNISEAIKHIRIVNNEISVIRSQWQDQDYQQLLASARSMKVSLDTVIECAKLGRLPVVNFAAGGVVTPADAAEMMKLRCDGIFIGSGVYKSEDPVERAEAICLAVAYYDDPEVVLEAQNAIDETKSMLGQDMATLKLRMQDRGSGI